MCTFPIQELESGFDQSGVRVAPKGGYECGGFQRFLQGSCKQRAKLKQEMHVFLSGCVGAPFLVMKF